jgi:hypothetical protein
MPHLRLEVPREWLDEDFVRETGFDARALLDHLVEVVASLRMENAAIEARRQEIRALGGNPDAVVSDEEAQSDVTGKPIEPVEVPLINRSNLKHALVPVVDSGVGGDHSRGFLHLTFSAGNDKPGRTAAVRRRAAETLGHAIDRFVGDLDNLGSVTVHVLDINRDRGYSTTAERRKQREEAKEED